MTLVRGLADDELLTRHQPGLAQAIPAGHLRDAHMIFLGDVIQGVTGMHGMRLLVRLGHGDMAADARRFLVIGAEQRND